MKSSYNQLKNTQKAKGLQTLAVEKLFLLKTRIITLLKDNDWMGEENSTVKKNTSKWWRQWTIILIILTIMEFMHN